MLLCLQFCHIDILEALALARLIAHIEPEFNKKHEVILFSSKMLGKHPIIKEMHEDLSKKFTTYSIQCSRSEEGYPAGPNAMWHDLIQQTYQLWRDKKTNQECIFTIEPDGCPARKNWLDEIELEFKIGQKPFCGCISEAAGKDHVNGNLVADIRVAATFPWLIGCDSQVAWDMFHADRLVKLATPSKLIVNDYRKPTITEAEMFDVRANGVAPAYVHGVRDKSAKELSRKRLVDLKRPEVVHL